MDQRGLHTPIPLCFRVGGTFYYMQAEISRGVGSIWSDRTALMHFRKVIAVTDEFGRQIRLVVLYLLALAMSVWNVGS